MLICFSSLEILRQPLNCKWCYSLSLSPCQHHLVPPPPRAKYIGSNDELILEDQMQRVTLCGNIPSEEMVTGIMGMVY